MIKRILVKIVFVFTAANFFFSCTDEQQQNKNQAEYENTFSWDNATVYFVYVDRFLNADTTNDQNYNRKTDYGSPEMNAATFHGGDIAGITQKLEEGYFTGLGINAIWVTGVYEQIHGWVGGGSENDFPHYAYHGYYPMDFTMMDKNYGTIEEFRTFVDLAHSKGIRVIMDAGLNHPGYNTLLDAVQYNFGGVDMTEAEAAEHISKLTKGKDKPHYQVYDYLKLFDFKNDSLWENWWGYDWIRTAEEVDKDVLTESIFGLADFRTEKTESVKLPKLLKNKWSMEGEDFTPWANPSAVKYRKDMDAAPADYLIKWLTAWVEEFGIDGFRCDVVENVDEFRWKQLNEECNSALNVWRTNNKAKAGAEWTDKFWMTGDIWGSGIEHRPNCEKMGYASIVNFKFPKDANLETIGQTWQNYADTLNTIDNWSTLSFINNTYIRGSDGENMIDVGTALLLSPGAVQIFYGDEVARKAGAGKTNSDPVQSYRSDYIWDNQNLDVLNHWQKLGQFRKKNISIGAGKQVSLGDNTYARIYDKNGLKNSVVIKISDMNADIVNVGEYFEEGSKLRNAYTGDISVVKEGKVEFKVKNKIILIEKI